MEFMVSSMRFWEVKILETKIGKSNTRIAVVEKEDPVGVKLGEKASGIGSILIPKYPRRVIIDKTAPRKIQRFKMSLMSFMDFKF